ncbi:L-glutamate gamma-semialdehyde dehydrogenase [Propioniciclava coleopterorum]|uniref:L-glutamate gamma-semialdehyde dehydrogenase n=1 Tax=Propioniciclava coleopterorum TaxID=2714937 RepID=A0A6G7Y8X9_9ACTN|nr:L-glutamate gamma-semialdehyde dehydrogenase [Propioniciclava coleopterorum]QIK73265.1 L-glutamate gamma-semialdehyde dehydrogenase [Propioniciclava coleopterorum]
MDAVTHVPSPVNEPVLGYAPGSHERAELEAMLAGMAEQDPVELTAWIGGERRPGGGEAIEVTMPSDHSVVLGVLHAATEQDARDAIDAALAAQPGWAAMSFDDRAAIMLKAADLIAGPRRATMNAATMLGQGKTAQQAEIDSACELADFLRFNVAFAREILADQPISSAGVWNRMEYRPLEGFVYAITPFNFTAIAGNLPTSAALMGNTVVWKPAVTQTLASHHFVEILREAGLPDGVINMLPGHGAVVSDVVLADPHLAGIHFTGSTRVFQSLWREVGTNIDRYHSYPRLVGETGGKDFVLAHPSADPAALVTALVRGAFEYSGQKCSAASRAFIPASVWEVIADDLAAQTDALAVGDVRDLSNFTSAVIDKRAFDKLAAVIDTCHADPTLEVIAGGTYDDSVGWFIRPTVVVGTDPTHEVFSTEYFGPILSVHVYPDDDFEGAMDLVDAGSPYALTGAIFASDRDAVARAAERLRFTAGNFYINDKPTGAVVGQQPFGGARASGTNDKAGSRWNMIRWASPRAIKETLVPPTSTDYPHMG